MAMLVLSLMLFLSFFSDSFVGFIMSTNAGVRWGEVKSNWGEMNPNWAKLKPSQKRSWSAAIIEPSKRSRWPPPRTRNIPYHDWGTGLLVWDTESCWWHCLSMECPDFPDVLDEDIFQL